MADQHPVLDGTDDTAEAAALARARADIAAGRVVPHEDVLRWVASWGTANERPRPVPRPR